MVRTVLDKDIIPKPGNRKLQTLTVPTVTAVVESVVDRGAATYADKVLTILKQLFEFAESRGYIDRAPAYALDRKDLGVVDNIRDCYLEADEIKAVWRTLNLALRLSLTVHLAAKVLLLIGARTGELLKARWEHLDFEKSRVVHPRG